MTTIFLRFADRAEAISTLGPLLGFDTEQDQDGKQLYSSGLYGGGEETRYHLRFLVDAGVPMDDDADYVNVLWPDGITLPDFGTYIVTPTNPRNKFQIG